MPKETKKQIKAQVTNEVRRAYSKKIDEYEARIKILAEMYDNEQKLYFELSKKYGEVSDKNRELSEKLAQYDEWVERMQDFCNLPENERQEAFKTYVSNIKSKAKVNSAMEDVLGFYSNIFSHMF